ncbi:unnamed protein product [Closterium sp. NIES-54]
MVREVRLGDPRRRRNTVTRCLVKGPAPSGVSQVDPPPLVEPLEISSDSSGPAKGGDLAADDTAATPHSPRLETPSGFPPRPSSPPLQPVAVDTGAIGGGDTGGEDTGGAGPGGAKTGGAVSPSGGGAVGASATGPGVGQQQPPSRLETPSPQQLREWVVWRGRSGAGAWSFLEAGAAGAGGAGGVGGVGGATGGTGGAGAADGTSTTPSRPLPSSTGLTPPLLCPTTDQSKPQLLPGSPLPPPAPHTEVTESLTECREPETRASTHVRARRVARPRPPAVPGTHVMVLLPSSVPHRVPLPSPPTSSLPDGRDPASDLARAASPTITGLLATVVTFPDLESTAAFSLVTELVDFDARRRLDYVASLVTESEYVRPPSVGGEPALSSDVLADRQFELECLATALPRFASMLLCPDGDPDAPDIPTPRSYAEAIAVNGTWIFRVKRPPGSPPAFKARYVAQGITWSFPAGTQWSLRRPVYGLRQAPYEWHVTLRMTLAALGFAPSSADPSLFLCTDLSSAVLRSRVPPRLGFATADSEALDLVKAELQERHTCTDLGELRSYLGLQITRDRARRTITLTQSYMVHQVLQRFGFQYSSPQPTPLPTGHSLSAPPFGRVHRAKCTSGMGLMLGGRGSVVLIVHSDASWANDWATQRSSQGYTFNLGSGSVSWRSTCSSSLRWLIYLLTDLGERPFSPLLLYVDNKAMLALCHEQRLEHKTKHIALSYFLARELQQRGHLRLSFVASGANTADVFTNASGLLLGADTLEAHKTAFALSRTELRRSAARDAAAILAITDLLPLSKQTHFGQEEMAKAQYDAVVVRYSTPATVSLGRHVLPFLFPDLPLFHGVADLILHLRSLNAQLRAAATEPALLAKDPPSNIHDPIPPCHMPP